MDPKVPYIVCTVAVKCMAQTITQHRTSESQSLLFLFLRSYTRRHENFIIEAQFIKNLEDGRTNDGLLQEGCRTRQSKLVDELLLLPEGGGVSHSKWVECLQLLLLRECDGVRDC